jgi:acetyl esterase/lipase
MLTFPIERDLSRLPFWFMAGDGSRGTNRNISITFSSRYPTSGFAWFSINYRLAPNYKFPGDVEKAVQLSAQTRANTKQIPNASL